MGKRALPDRDTCVPAPGREGRFTRDSYSCTQEEGLDRRDRFRKKIPLSLWHRDRRGEV